MKAQAQNELCRANHTSVASNLGKTNPFGIVPWAEYTAKMNRVDPRAWLADVLARIADHPVHRLDELLPWNWRRPARVGSRGLTRHVNKVSHVKTVDRVARELGEYIDLLHEVALDMDVEDGVIWV